MNNQHAVVVGAGAGGLTMALLLAAAGRRVTLLEITPRIGGYLQRFRREGVPFDTGFHFTGGFENVLAQMLRVLRIDDVVHEEAFGSRIFFGDTGRGLTLPGGGWQAVADYLSDEYPEQRERIQAYYRCEREVIEHTPMFDLRDRDVAGKLMLNEYDFLTLDDYLDKLGVTGELRAVLSSAAMCHGTPPCETSVTHHCRVSYGLGNHIARVRRGGDAFLEGFRREAARLGITVRTGVTVTECLEWSGRECRRVGLSDGGELEFDAMFLAIHPRSILRLLPERVGNAFFRERVAGLEDSCGFFSVFGVLDEALKAPSELTSYMSTADLNRILLPGRGASGTGMVSAHEVDAEGRPVTTLTAFRTAYPAETRRWEGMPDRESDPAYREYKERMTETVLAEVFRAYPQYRGKLRVLASSSLLSCRDYVPPTGCAYGVRQKLGEPRLFGRLPVRNFYALGHGALIPGVLGTMMASFLLFRQMVGEQAYHAVIRDV